MNDVTVNTKEGIITLLFVFRYYADDLIFNITTVLNKTPKIFFNKRIFIDL